MFNTSADMFMKELDKMADTDESFLLGEQINRATLDVIMRVSRRVMKASLKP
jgi:hypothetical protein